VVVAEYAMAYEHAGSYAVLIRTEGYSDWLRQGVKVSEGGGCGHVNTVALTAKLLRTSASSE